MVKTSEKYWECPKCGWVLSFKYAHDKGKYVSTCPYCKDRLEIDKEEYEEDRGDELEIYFEPDQGIFDNI